MLPSVHFSLVIKLLRGKAKASRPLEIVGEVLGVLIYGNLLKRHFEVLSLLAQLGNITSFGCWALLEKIDLYAGLVDQLLALLDVIAALDFPLGLDHLV